MTLLTQFDVTWTNTIFRGTIYNQILYEEENKNKISKKKTPLITQHLIKRGNVISEPN